MFMFLVGMFSSAFFFFLLSISPRTSGHHAQLRAVLVHHLEKFFRAKMTVFTFSIICMVLLPCCIIMLPHRTNTTTQRTWMMFSHLLFLLTPVVTTWGIVRIFLLR